VYFGEFSRAEKNGARGIAERVHGAALPDSKGLETPPLKSGVPLETT
jgi:hypothetical protein